MSPGENPFETPRSPEEPSPLLDADDEVLAEPGQRLVAVVIDSAITMGLCAPLLLIFAENETLTIVSVAITVLLVLAFSVYQAVLLSTLGQTVGKKAMGIKVVRIDGQPIDFVHAVLLRVVVMSMITGLTSACGSIISLADSLFIFREDRRCIHDHLASTKVIVAVGEN